MFNLKFYLNDQKRLINKTLSAMMEKIASQGRLAQAMAYSLLAGGKRIRPILCLAAADAVGAPDPDPFLHPACSIELIHTYSLIHDDLPAMDNDDLRRGKPTCHIQFDHATAILAGDALLTMAFQILSDPALSAVISPEQQVQLIHVISSAAGPEGMVMGQMMDILNEGLQISLSQLRKMHSLKTGALFEAAVVAGAILAGGDHHQITALRTYGRNIGIAFQVADDILNVEGNPELMGKSVGTDETGNKCTYPSIMGMEASRRFALDLIDNALKVIDDFDKRALPLREIAGYIINRNR